MLSLEENLKNLFGLEDQREIVALSELFTPKQFSRNELLQKTGSTCDTMIYIQSGFVRIYHDTPDKEITQWISSPGYFLTDLASFIYDQPARFHMQALSDVEALVISKEKYNTIQQFIPRWPEMERMFIIHCFITLENRIFSHLAMTAEERYAYFFEHNKELFNQVPLQYIASMLGMTAETFSRVRKKLL